MAVTRRALALATRGVLAGGAIALATHGIIQTPSGTEVRAQNTVHEHVVDTVGIQQQHNLTVSPTVHLQTADLIGWPARAPPVAPPAPPPRGVGGASYRYGYGTTHIDYAIPYFYRSEATFLLTSSTTFKHVVEENTLLVHKSSTDLVLYGQSINWSTHFYKQDSNINVLLVGRTRPKFTAIQRYTSTSPIVLSSDTVITWRTPSQLKFNSYLSTGLYGQAEHSYKPAPQYYYQTTGGNIRLTGQAVISSESVIEEPANNYSHHSYGVLSLIGHAEELFTADPLNEYLYVSNGEAYLHVDAIRKITTVELTEIKHLGQAQFKISGKAQVVHTVVPETDNNMETLLLLAANYFFNEE